MDILRTPNPYLFKVEFESFNLSLTLCFVHSHTIVRLVCSNCHTGNMQSLYSGLRCNLCTKITKNSGNVGKSTVDGITHELISTWLTEDNDLNTIQVRLATSEIILALKNFDIQERFALAAAGKPKFLVSNK